METCEKCRRLRGMESIDLCFATDEGLCRIAAASYRRGYRAGVEMAQERVRDPYCGAVTDWSDVDKEVRRVCG